MKLFITTCLFIISQLTFSQTVNIPDANFKQALLDHTPPIDTNNDGEIQLSEAQATSVVNVMNKNVSDLTGISAFTNLQDLLCRSNPITSLDISSNTQLVQLWAGFTDISSLNTSQNGNLYIIRIENSNVTDLDITNNPLLEWLDASYSPLQNLSTASTTALSVLSVENTNLQSLDGTAHPQLELLNIVNTSITNIDFTFLQQLKSISLGSDLIPETLDFSQNTNLCSLYIQNSPQLEYINLKNGNNTLLVPNSDCSVNLTYGGIATTSGVNAQFNVPNLQTICVDNIAFAQQNFTLVPPQTVFIDDCNLGNTENPLTSLELYPNPVTEVVYLDSYKTISSITILSPLGQTLKSFNPNNKKISINLEEFAAGIYFIQIESENIQILKRIIKK
ncbi:T9SS type A sorting domain-containing protein [Aequorivita echinoideorum]|uniref:T9SS type A sorting domain-containing protein n=1 Tax=Aequorivita echinoideorum TaxID=1549647 RepID=A0ABS5S406_9FLAO|nr:T9SS type A sorting domain-containing protein [Aequorivita echinoideorum]MBT0607941.1 T9SS type A sorting domain-containing protein [Aequorivita echinoideorum]